MVGMGARNGTCALTERHRNELRTYGCLTHAAIRTIRAGQERL